MTSYLLPFVLSPVGMKSLRKVLVFLEEVQAVMFPRNLSVSAISISKPILVASSLSRSQSDSNFLAVSS